MRVDGTLLPCLDTLIRYDINSREHEFTCRLSLPTSTEIPLRTQAQELYVCLLVSRVQSEYADLARYWVCSQLEGSAALQERKVIINLSLLEWVYP